MQTSMANTVGFHKSSPARTGLNSTTTVTTTTTSGSLSSSSPSRPSNKSAMERSVAEVQRNNALPMPSELFYVIGENAPMLSFTQAQRKHIDHFKQSGIKWQWKQFDNPAREDGLRLSHWERVSPSSRANGGVSADDGIMAIEDNPTSADQDSSSQEYQYAKYNTTTNVYSYSSDEYVSHLRDESGNWSREETDYLFALCHQYDLRWFVIKDRWDFDNEGFEQQQQQPQPVNAETAVQQQQQQQQRQAGSTPQTSLTELPNGDSASKPPSADAGASSEAKASTDIDQKPAITANAIASGPFAGPPAQAAAQQPDVSQKRERTIEEMKDRYYSVCRRLIRARPASDENAKQALLQSYAFDKDREAARKHHIQNVLMKRTPQQLEEEEFLYIESRRIEQQYSQMSREREELWRTLCGVGPQSTSALALNSPFLSPAARENAATAAGLSNKKRRRGELDMLEDPNNTGQKVASTSTLPQLAPAQDEQYGITRFDASTPASSVTRPSGVYLRSSKPPQLKTSLAPKIIAALAEQGISMRLAMPTRQNMEKLEALVSAITSLLDCKKQVERAEYEVKVLKTRKEASMRIEEEDRAIKAQEDEEARKQRDASALASTGEGLTPQRETSSTASSMQVDA